MPGTATLRHDGNVAVITVDNPPVNALSHDVRTALVDAFSRARDDAKVEAIVLTADGRTFVAGADITEFDKPPMAPGLSDVIALIDAINKPVVAAVFGTPLGGGLEITLACHFRVAQTGTRLGLPEIKLGLIPGAGGTQRLPRLDRHGKSRRDDLVRRSDPGERCAGGRADRRDFRGRSGCGGHCFRAKSPRREAAARSRARPREQACRVARQSGRIRRGHRRPYQTRTRPRCADGGNRGLARRASTCRSTTR